MTVRFVRIGQFFSLDIDFLAYSVVFLIISVTFVLVGNVLEAMALTFFFYILT